MRGIRQRAGAGIAAVLLATLAAGTLAAPLDEAIRLREEGNVSALKSQERIDALSDATDDLAGQYRDVLQQIDGLRVYNRQLERLLASQDAEAASLQEEIDRVELTGRQLTPLMLRMIDSLEEFVRLDVPFLLEERMRRVANLRELMERADVAESEKYRRVLEAYQIENDYGRTIEAYQAELEKGGVSRTVSFLRVGRVALVFQTLDGEQAGAWDTARGEWVALPASYRSSIRRGLRIARKHAAPDLITLPIQAAEAAR